MNVFAKRPRKLPTTVLFGLLGAGKTTVLANRGGKRMPTDRDKAVFPAAFPPMRRRV